MPPASYLTSPKDQGTNDSLDSDIDPITMRTAIVTVTVAQSLKWDAGFYLGATIGDRAWNDANRNGIQDTGEANLAGQNGGSARVTVP